HASDNPAFGGKLGIDATGKIEGELVDRKDGEQKNIDKIEFPEPVFKEVLAKRLKNLPFFILSPKQKSGGIDFDNLKTELTDFSTLFPVRLFLLIEPDVEAGGIGMITWYLLANSDPVRDGWLIGSNCLFIDGTIKAFNSGFKRRWPNVVSSSLDTIERVDAIWGGLGLGKLIESPSRNYKNLIFPGKDFIQV
ncbi:MAG TPA: hypothetical protein GXZ49_00525, partial [Bacteroidetes bacterium]|nr:hypothetical protein [Bacteroidota bacterium]